MSFVQGEAGELIVTTASFLAALTGAGFIYSASPHQRMFNAPILTAFRWWGAALVAIALALPGLRFGVAAWLFTAMTGFMLAFSVIAFLGACLGAWMGREQIIGMPGKANRHAS